MNTPVNFEIAKLLKEKGFDLKVRSMYCEEKLHRDTNLKGNYNDVIWVRTWRNSPYDDTVSAPTITEAVMWLYEKHGIWISIHSDKALNWKSLFSIKIDWTYPKDSTIKGIKPKYFKYKGKNEFNSPTEAYEAAIEYTLNNLI
jgi:hypothetical protein